MHHDGVVDGGVGIIKAFGIERALGWLARGVKCNKRLILIEYRITAAAPHH